MSFIYFKLYYVYFSSLFVEENIKNNFLKNYHVETF